MSFTAIEGYGINVSELTHEIEMDHLLDLIKTAPKLYERMSNDLAQDGVDIETCDPFDILTSWVEVHGDVQCGGLAEIMQKVIEEVENIRFSVVLDYDLNAYLVYRPDYPWIKLTKEEKQLTEEKIDKLMNKYLSIATPESLYPAYQSIELEC